jgi:transposase
MGSLVEQGWAEQSDVARAFGRSARTVRRLQRRFEAGGLPALARAAGYPPGRPRLKRSRELLVSRLKAEGLSNREIARRIGGCGFRPCRSAIPADADHPFRPRRSPGA